MNQQDKIWDELYEKKDDITEWLQLLDNRSRDEPEPIWGELNTHQVINLTRQILEEFINTLNQVSNQKKELRELEKFSKMASQEIEIAERSLKNA